jgi:hypothetical protein
VSSDNGTDATSAGSVTLGRPRSARIGPLGPPIGLKKISIGSGSEIAAEESVGSPTPKGAPRRSRASTADLSAAGTVTSCALGASIVVELNDDERAPVLAGLFQLRITCLENDAACAQIDALAEKLGGNRRAMFYGAPSSYRL